MSETKIILKHSEDDDLDVLTSESMEDCIKQNSDNIISNYDFLTAVGKALPVSYVNAGSKHIDRKKAVQKLNDYIHNMSICSLIEEGLFEYTLVYSKINDLLLHIIYAVYEDKLMNIVDNINKHGSIENDYLIAHIQEGKLNPKSIAFLSPMEMFPQNWEFYNRKNTLRKYKEENMAATDNYECRRCHEKKCKVTQLQTRSADEPMTNFVSCLVCGFTFKH